MKRFIMSLLIIGAPLVSNAKEKTDTIQIKAEDFVVAYLNAALSKNPFLERKQGWGLIFGSKNSGSRIYISARGSYFDKSEIKHVEQAMESAKFQYNELAKKYALEGRLELKTEISEIKN